MDKNLQTSTSRGLIFIHSCPKALCKHIEWVLSEVLGYPVKMEWVVQPAAPNMLRSEFSWSGPAGTGSALTSALRGWEHLRYEVTEEPSGQIPGGRWSHTPDLGIFYAQTDAHGNVVVPENRIRAALEKTDPQQMRQALEIALGTAWDEEIEPFRYAGQGAPVRWLHQIG